MEMLGRVGFAAKVYGKLGFIREIKFPATSKEKQTRTASILFIHH